MRKHFFHILQSVAAAIPIALFGFAEGPPIMRTGAAVDGGQNCTVCHNSFTLNDDSGGSVVIRANPYTPGVKQIIEVQVSHPTAVRFGFQLIARLASDETQQAGTFTVDDNIRVRCAPAGADAPCSGALEFAEHKPPSTNIGNPGPRTFLVEWTPPATDMGPVNLYAAGNAANGNLADTGDHIYTTHASIASKGGSSVLNSVSSALSIAPYGWVSIFGAKLATGNRGWTAADFVNGALPQTLEGTSVTIGGKPAFVSFVSPAQVNVLAPFGATTGPVSVQVTTGGTVTQSSTAYMQTYSPALFTSDGDVIIAQHADFSPVGTASPAKPGETIIVYGSGFGLTSPAIDNGQVLSAVSTLIALPVFRIGGVNVQPSFAGMTAAGLYQFNITVPASTADGDTPVIATVGGVSSPGSVTIRVQH
jgi:uncharacterized protein (TIGR03437 family)